MLRGLHKLCDKGCWSEANDAIKSGKIDVGDRGGYGDWTPLHLACRRDPPLFVVQSLIERAPEALLEADNYGRVPLHHATERGDSLEVIEFLVKSCPESITKVDHEGRTPIHLSITASNRESRQRRPIPSLEEIDLLLEKENVNNENVDNPAVIPDSEGSLPLHAACDNIDEMSLELIQKLVGANPRAVVYQNSNGHTPLHLAFLKALEKPPSFEIISTLLQTEWATEICNITDGKGMLPLHGACRNFASFEVLQQLLIHNPKAAAVQCTLPSSEELVYPIDILEDLRCSITVEDEIDELNFKSDLLFAAFPSVMPYCIQPERLKRLSDLIIYEAESSDCLSSSASSIWHFLCTHSENGTETLYMTIVKNIIDSLPYECVRKLAAIEVTDNNGKVSTIRESATHKCASLLSPYFRFADKFEFDYDPEIHQNLGDIVIHETDCSLLVKAWFCNEKDGTRSPAIIKFMEDSHKFTMELEVYDKLSSSSCILPLLMSLSTDRVGTPKETPSDLSFARDTDSSNSLLPSSLNLKKYHHAIVTPLGDRDLEDILKHEKCSETDINSRFNDIVFEVGSILEQFHEKGFVHGNLSLSSIIRVKDSLHLINLDSVKSLVNETKHYIGGIGLQTETYSIATGDFPPDMFATLDSSQAFKFCSYWKQFMDDWRIMEIMRSEPEFDGKISTKINSFLGDEKSYQSMYNRVQRNAQFWEKIKPRRFKDCNGKECFAVLKCFRIDDHSGKPFCPKMLPYELVPLSKSYDTWKYGLMIFELFVDRTIFQLTGSRDIMNDDDFVKMTNWSEVNVLENIFEQHKKSIPDPLLMDLLQTILSPRLHERHQSITRLLDHVFFNNSDCGNEMVIQRRRNVVHKLEAMKWKTTVKNRRKQEYEKWLCGKTTEINSFLSPSLQYKFHQGAAQQWDNICGKIDDHFPTSVVVLPYLIEGNNGFVAYQNEDVADTVASLLADVVLFASFASQASKVENALERDQTEEVLQFVDPAESLTNNGIVTLCERVINRTAAAEKALTTLLEGVLEQPEVAAKKLIHDTIEEIVDIRTCVDVLKRAKMAEDAFALLITGMVDDPIYSAKQIVNQKFGNLVDPNFFSSLVTEIQNFDTALETLIQSFYEDTAHSCIDILATKVGELLDIYDASEKLFSYIVDECTGKPILNTNFQIANGEKMDVFVNLLPAMFLTARSICSLGVTHGVSSLVGLSMEQMNDHHWLRMSQCHLDGELSALHAFTMFQHSIDTLYGRDFTSDISTVASKHRLYLQQFLEESDDDVVRRKVNFVDLRRLKSAESILWTTLDGEEQILLSNSKPNFFLMEYGKKKQAELSEEIEVSMRKQGIIANFKDDISEADDNSMFMPNKTIQEMNTDDDGKANSHVLNVTAQKKQQHTTGLVHNNNDNSGSYHTNQVRSVKTSSSCAFSKVETFVPDIINSIPSMDASEATSSTFDSSKSNGSLSKQPLESEAVVSKNKTLSSTSSLYYQQREHKHQPSVVDQPEIPMKTTTVGPSNIRHMTQDTDQKKSRYLRRWGTAAKIQ